MEESVLGSLNLLPEGCVSTILSLTSPSDACSSSLVSSTFRSAAESDVVWESFLPSDYRAILLSSITTLKFSSKKELFFGLCNPILVDGGKKSFRLEKSSGKKTYMLSARELSITWTDNPEYWRWKSTPDSRFAEVAELITINWLEIEGKIRTQMLSPNTKYGAYLVMKIADRAYGLDLIPSEISVEMGSQVSTNTAYLSRQDSKKEQMERLFYGNRMQMLKSRFTNKGDGRVPSERKDGWMEIELGEFFTGQDGASDYDQEVKMSLREVKGYQLKGGLLVEGIEVRPKQ